MIKIRIRNADHEIDVQFPISENKLYAKLAEIHAIEGKDAPQSAFVTEVYTPAPKSVQCSRMWQLYRKAKELLDRENDAYDPRMSAAMERSAESM